MLGKMPEVIFCLRQERVAACARGPDRRGGSVRAAPVTADSYHSTMDPYNTIFRQVQLPQDCKGRLFLTAMPGRYHDIQEALEAWNTLKSEVGKEHMLL